jgi:PAS domain S-box-containing protein
MVVKSSTFEDEIAKKLLRLSVYLNALGIVGNIISHLYSAAIVTLFGTIFFFILSRLFEKNYYKKTITKTNIVLSYYAYFTLIWFYNAGSSGSTIILFVILFFLTFVIVPSSKHLHFIIGALLLIIILYVSEYFFPQTILQQYSTRFDRFFDVFIVTILALFLMKNLIEVISEYYLYERNLVHLKNIELEKNKNELKESKDFFNKLAEKLPGISYQFVMNEKGESWFNYVNGNVYDIFEVLPEKVYSDHNFVYNIMDRKDRIIFYRDIIYSFNNLSNFNNQHKIITTSGKVKYISTQAKPEKLSNGNVVWYGYSEEVTERIKEEEILKESEEKLRFISENTSDGIIVYEKSGITYASKSYSNIFGYSKDEIIGKNETDSLNLIHPNDRNGFLKSFENAIKNNQHNLVYEYRYYHKKGYYVWREDTFSIFYNENKNFDKFIIVIRDITEKKNISLNFEQMKSMLEQTSSIAKVGGWEVNMLTNEVIWTDLIYEIYDLNKNEFKPNIYSILRYFKKGNSRHKITNFFKNANTLENYYDEQLELVSATGKNKWVRAIGKPLFENGVCIKVFGTFQDITIQKQQELKLKELALVASKTNDAIILTDENAKILWVNNAFEKMTEYSLEEVIGKEQKNLLYGTNTNWNMIHKMMDSTKKFEPVNATLLNYTKSGKPIWFDISVTPVFDDFGVCTNFIDVKKDATERVEKHQQLQELTKITSDQNERLLNFTYIISHNIRSHSANISGIVNLIEVSENLEEKETFFQMLKTSTNNLEETIQNLNEIISIQSNSNQNYSTLNLKLEIEKTFAIVIDSIKSSGINIENKVSETINLNVIPAYLDSILLNLITNAIKYRSLEKESYLKITSSENENYFIISFEDNGLGLNLKKHKEKLFGMYKTFHKNLNSKGLGLFITKNQIEAMDGKIEVESEENKGSTFKIFFPKNKIDNILN